MTNLSDLQQEYTPSAWAGFMGREHLMHHKKGRKPKKPRTRHQHIMHGRMRDTLGAVAKHDPYGHSGGGGGGRHR